MIFPANGYVSSTGWMKNIISGLSDPGLEKPTSANNMEIEILKY